MEIDPVIQKAMHLLISRKPDSTEKLKQMLFDSLGREYVPPSVTKASKLKNQISHSQDSVESLDDDEANDMEAETDCSTDVGGTNNDDTMDADDFAFDMGISCVICRQFDVSSNNQLLECQECHSLYHQMCHKPAVNEGEDATDPRFVWHCYKCSSTATSVKVSPEKVKASKVEEGTSSKSESSETFKKPDKKSEKSSGESSKDKKLKSDKKAKDKSADKNKGESDKEKVKKHKSSDKETKSDGNSSRKDKVSSKSSESTKTTSSTAGKSSGSSSSTKDKSNEKHKQSSSTSSSGDLKHKRSEVQHDKEKKAKKPKKEKSE